VVGVEIGFDTGADIGCDTGVDIGFETGDPLHDLQVWGQFSEASGFLHLWVALFFTHLHVFVCLVSLLIINLPVTSLHVVGLKIGFDTGADIGFDTGADIGFETGAVTGFDTGADDGFDTGVDTGFDTGADDGFDTGDPLHDLQVWGQFSETSGFVHRVWLDLAAHLQFLLCLVSLLIINLPFTSLHVVGFEIGFDTGADVGVGAGADVGVGAGADVGEGTGADVDDPVPPLG
jgi:hypothetical protein